MIHRLMPLSFGFGQRPKGSSDPQAPKKPDATQPNAPADQPKRELTEAELKEYVSNHPKLDPRTRFMMISSYQGGPIRLALRANFQGNDTQVLAEKGVTIYPIAGNIYTAQANTLNALADLLDHTNVSYAEGGRPMYPDGEPKKNAPAFA